MKLTLKIDPEFERLMEEGPERMRRAIIRGLHRGSEIVAAAAMRNLRKNKSTLTGALAIATGGGWRVDENALKSTIGPAMARRSGRKVNYGQFVEEGRGPGRMPPVGSLRLFLKMKAGVGEGDLDRAEFGLRRSIAAKGTKGRPFLEPALKENKSKIQAAFELELQNELDAMDAEGSS